MNRFIGLLFGLVLLLVYGCNSTILKSTKPKRIYIASDFLTRSDTTLFNDFRKKEQIKVVILPMSVDSIVAHYKQYKYNSKFDLVLLKTTQGLAILSKNNVLHPISESHLWENIGFVSPNSDWLSIGLDPYIATGLKERRAFQYNEFTYGLKWEKVLDDEEMTSFESSVMYQFGRNHLDKSVRWLKKLNSQIANPRDTLEHAPFYLTRLSKVKEGKEIYVYPNQIMKYGAFYDGIGVGIIRHSTKYTAALSFIQLYTKSLYNQKLCGRLHLLPVMNPEGKSPYAYQNNYPMLFRCSPRNAVSNFRDLKRIQNRI